MTCPYTLGMAKLHTDKVRSAVIRTKVYLASGLYILHLLSQSFIVEFAIVYFLNSPIVAEDVFKLLLNLTIMVVRLSRQLAYTGYSNEGNAGRGGC